MKENNHSHPVVIFDGECALCNRFVTWVIRADRARAFLYTPNSSEFAQVTLARAGRAIERFDSVVFVSDRGVFELSDAVLEIGRELGFPFSALVIGRVIPRAVRDRMYRFIATRRIQWFGRVESCGVIPPELRERIR